MTDFLPYARQSIEDEDVAAVVRVLRSDRLTTGPEIPLFEAALAEAVGAREAAAVSSGTAALHAACAALGLGPGDEVIVPAVTFLATANSVRHVGAEPVFADVDPQTGLIDPDSVAANVTERTRAVIAVHLAGASADMAWLGAITERAGVALVEDAAHALGATQQGQAIGSCGNGARLATFSFHPVKHITTGEGGAVTGQDSELLRRVRRIRDHGIERQADRFEQASPGPWFYEMQELGHNFRMTDLQAALGRSQLGRLARFVARRRSLALAYDRQLPEISHARPAVTGGAREGCAYHLYPVLIDFDAWGTTRTEVMRRLREDGIGTQVHYIPLPMQPYYRRRGWDPEAFPGACRYYARTLSLPMFPAMADDDVPRVVDALGGALSGARGGRR
jgi:UDP-4-amino-4,6-dideoxy-N-acetyl-beta-L-altrosamine transaminase